jgi:hypothetical protein
MILKYKGGGSQDSQLDLCDQVVKVRAEALIHMAGLPNESNILQDICSLDLFLSIQHILRMFIKSSSLQKVPRNLCQNSFKRSTHRHLSNIDCLVAHTACPACFISTVKGCNKKRRL